MHASSHHHLESLGTPPSLQAVGWGRQHRISAGFQPRRPGLVGCCSNRKPHPESGTVAPQRLSASMYVASGCFKVARQRPACCTRCNITLSRCYVITVLLRHFRAKSSSPEGSAWYILPELGRCSMRPVLALKRMIATPRSSAAQPRSKEQLRFPHKKRRQVNRSRWLPGMDVQRLFHAAPPCQARSKSYLRGAARPPGYATLMGVPRGQGARQRATATK